MARRNVVVLSYDAGSVDEHHPEYTLALLATHLKLDGGFRERLATGRASEPLAHYLTSDKGVDFTLTIEEV